MQNGTLLPPSIRSEIHCRDIYPGFFLKKILAHPIKIDLTKHRLEIGGPISYLIKLKAEFCFLNKSSILARVNENSYRAIPIHLIIQNL